MRSCVHKDSLGKSNWLRVITAVAEFTMRRYGTLSTNPDPFSNPLLPPEYFTSPGVQVRPSQIHHSKLRVFCSLDM